MCGPEVASTKGGVKDEVALTKAGVQDEVALTKGGVQDEVALTNGGVRATSRAKDQSSSSSSSSCSNDKLGLQREKQRCVFLVCCSCVSPLAASTNQSHELHGWGLLLSLRQTTPSILRITLEAGAS
eukprot:1161606-Pelagomonas_calceolata.AAC.8